MQFKGKYRGNSKIKYQHSMIQGLRECLEKIQEWEEITAINPGRISKSKSTGTFKLKVQYKTHSGLKCIATSTGGSSQEVFIVASQPDIIKRKIETLPQNLKRIK